MWEKVKRYNYTYTVVRNRRISIFGFYMTKKIQNTEEVDWEELTGGHEYLFYFNPDNETYPETNTTMNKLPLK